MLLHALGKALVALGLDMEFDIFNLFLFIKRTILTYAKLANSTKSSTSGTGKAKMVVGRLFASNDWK